jgi:hypothetical protein
MRQVKNLLSLVLFITNQTIVTFVPPHELLFIKSVNEHKNDPAGLFIHRRFKEIDNPPMVVHWHSDIWPTKSQAILSAIKRQHEKLSDLLFKVG